MKNDIVRGEVHVMDSDGANPTNLTNNPADDRAPHWNAFSYWLHLPIMKK
jgi:hypothetical protein